MEIFCSKIQQKRCVRKERATKLLPNPIFDSESETFDELPTLNMSCLLEISLACTIFNNLSKILVKSVY